MLVSILVILILPKILLAEGYGYYQLFIFYLSYIGFFHLGWIDGIYLRYGGMNYSKLNFNLFNSQFLMLFLSQTIIGILVIIIANIVSSSADKIFIFIMIGLTVIIVNSRYMLVYVLQATNRIKESATIILVERIIFIILTFFLIMLNITSFKSIILIDVVSKTISFVLAIVYCKEIILRNIRGFYFDFQETIENIRSGIKLMIANFSSLLIIGSVMFGIEKTWDVTTFGKISLTLSICNFMMIFISAIGIILFPILRRTNSEIIGNIYFVIRDFLGVFFLGILLLYFPLKISLMIWLPNYNDSFMYMSLVFPIVFFEGKMSILINTYMKTLRKEKLLLRVNVTSFIMSFLITVLTIGLMKNLESAIISIFILLAFRTIFAEILLSYVLRLHVLKDIMFELIVTTLFIIFNWYLNIWMALISYLFIYFLYVFVKNKDLLQSIKYIRVIIKN
jgi:O-antigen/teichoic acid export membrane protein